MNNKQDINNESGGATEAEPALLPTYLVVKWQCRGVWGTNLHAIKLKNIKYYQMGQIYDAP
jgi:hypothetical protein